MRTYHLQSFSGTLVTLTAACLTCSLLLLGFAGSLRAEVIVDDDFSSGLGAWNTEGLVGLERDTPILADGAVVPALWTGGEVTGYMHEIRFEVFLGGLSPDAGTGTVDKFQITVHVGDDPSTVGPSSNTSSKVVLEVTGDGTLSGLSTALIVPDIAKGDGWYSGIVEVAISETAAAISFSIANNNGLSDSTITLDYVRVSLIARGRLSNISNRGDALTGGGILITGFVLRGTEGKSLLVRAMGPRLESPFGVLGYLSDPILDLIPGGASQSIAQNDDWQVSSNAAEIAQAITALGAYPFDEGSKDSAMLVKDLEPIAQGYTVWVSGVGNTTGVSLAEVYAADSGVDGPTELVNISSRGPIGDGNHRPILGWVLSGDRGRKIMARAMGPTLNASPQDGGFGLSGFVDDPVLEIYQYVSETQSNDLIYTNDDWGLADNAIEVPVVGAAVGAFTPVTGSKDAVVLASLSPGIYTAVAKTKNGEHGLALVELYVVTDNRRPVATNNLIFVSAGVQSIIPVEPFIANYVDPDNDTLVIVSYGQPTHGTLTRNEAGDFVFAPPTGYIGETLFSYTVSDGEYESLPATVALQVAPPNTAIWVGGAEGNFSDADNWQDGEVPGPDDTVWLADIDQDFTVHLDVDATINALRVGGAGANVVFKMTSGRSLTVTEGVDVQPGSILELQSGTLNTTGDARISGHLHWSGGTMSGSGETIIVADGSALLDGDVHLRETRRFTNNGSLVQTGENSMIVAGSGESDVVVTNAGGASWKTENRNGSTILYVPGSYAKAAFSNEGTLLINSSSTIGGGNGPTVLTNSGAIEIAKDESFTISTGTHHFASGASSSGNGELKITAGMLNISGESMVEVLRLEGGTLRVNDGPLSTVDFAQTGGILNGAEALTVTGSMVWTSGEHRESGTTIVAATATALIDGDVHLRDTRRFTNEGSLVQKGENSMIVAGGGESEVTVTNTDGATWTTEQRNSESILYVPGSYAKTVFSNEGTLLMNSSSTIGGGNGSTRFDNNGLVDVKVGDFTCNANAGQHSGDWKVAAGASYIFNSGAHTLGEGAGVQGNLKISGSASVSVTSSVNFSEMYLEGGLLSVDGDDGSLSVGQISLTGGTLTGAKMLTVTNSLHWSGGTMSGSGETIIVADGSALLDGDVHLRETRRFTNNGSLVQTGENSMIVAGSGESDVVVTNAGSASWKTENRSGSTILYVPGSYAKAAFSNEGTLLINSSGTIGGGNGSTVMTNSGTIEIVEDESFGLSAITAIFENTSMLKLVTAGTAVVTGIGSLTFDGGLEVIWADGYTPASGAVIPLIEYGSHNGTFTVVTVPQGRAITNTSYGPTHLEITLD